MRIQGSGSAFSGDSSGRDQDRAGRFRRSHRVGQKVRGTVVEWRGPDLAWVELDNHGLLARISADPSLGQERTFLILSLTPDIVLREVRESSRLDTLV